MSKNAVAKAVKHLRPEEEEEEDVSSSPKSFIALSYTNHFIGKLVSLWLDADGNPLPPPGQRAQIKRSGH